jgi:hypothetical protein
MPSEVAPADLPPQSCRLLLKGARKNIGRVDYPNHYEIRYEIPEWSCSATLVGRTQLVTAAHCLVGIPFISGEILCPGQAPRRLTQQTTPQGFHTGAGRQIDCQNTARDIAVIGVDRPFDLSPIRIADTASQIDALVAKPGNCHVYGYGIDASGKTGNHNGRTVTFGKWHTGDRTERWVDEQGRVVRTGATTPVYESVSRCGTFLLQGAYVYPGDPKPHSVIQQGDSGGGLICRDSDGQSILVGVTSSESSNDGQPTGDSVSLAPHLDTLRSWIRQQVGGTPHLALSDSSPGAAHDPAALP